MAQLDSVVTAAAASGDQRNKPACQRLGRSFWLHVGTIQWHLSAVHGLHLSLGAIVDLPRKGVDWPGPRGVACLAVETAVILGGAFWVWRRSGTGLR